MPRLLPALVFALCVPVAVASPAAPLANAEADRARQLEAKIDAAATPQAVWAALAEGWANPPATYRPHTRWWWPGNAMTPGEIDAQLRAMHDAGIGGVEIMSFTPVYEKGNTDFGSPQFFELVRHTVAEARRLGLSVSLNLGPGWGPGNPWVAPADRLKLLVVVPQDIEGGPQNGLQDFALALPAGFTGEKKLEAVVAVALGADGKPDPARRINLTASVSGGKEFAVAPAPRLDAALPPGRWRVLNYWTAYSGMLCKFPAPCATPPYVADVLDAGAVRRMVEASASRYRAAVGQDFGATVDSYFGDSLELGESMGFSLWSAGLFERFKKEKGYDLRPYLPLLQYDGAPETPYVRGDFGDFLHRVGMASLIGTLADGAAADGVKMRQQPHYRFVAELIEASGRLQAPETEMTRRSFDPSAYPHKLTVSGAQLYPSKEKRWVSAEAFTFIDDRYRTTLEEIKQATDLFLRDGIGQLYNHGYFASPERDPDPARDLLWMNRISPGNTWWPEYPGLAAYQARATFLARQGRPVARVLLYSPMPSVWARQAEFPLNYGVRAVPFGPLPKFLVASGYDFDCVNDDLLQHAAVRAGGLEINGYHYDALVLPRAETLDPATLAVLDRFVRAGGAVFALGALPVRAPGLVDHVARDRAVAEGVAQLFAPGGGTRQVGQGMTGSFPGCGGFEPEFSPPAVDWQPTVRPDPAYAAFLAALRGRIAPDFEMEGQPLSDGLTFRHSRIGPVDAWFVCNLEPKPARGTVRLATRGRCVQLWNPLTGARHALPPRAPGADGRLPVDLDLAPWASCWLIVSDAPDPALPLLPRCMEEESQSVVGPWEVAFTGLGLGKAAPQRTLPALADWRDLPGLHDFSGRAVYRAEIDLPAAFLRPDRALFLDLGAVHESAAVRVNGQAAGVAWMELYRVPLSGLLHPGKNRIEVEVANLLWNYAAGLPHPTPIPPELRAHYGAEADPAYPAWQRFQETKAAHGDDRLPSGLLGPVRIVACRPADS